ncbi:MAG: class III extradiol dioxygenase family protein [Proteobacteria bacterium]|nr:class III extradiol dioxygenase family protein [Pseudomonadota bacterium]
MARLIGGIGSSHVPAIGNAIEQNMQSDPYWKSFFDGYVPAWKWLEERKPDVAILVYNDHGLNFFLDKMPTFAIGAAPQYLNSDEGWGLKPLPPFQGHPELSWHIIDSLVNDEFDITMCQEMQVDHGFTVPMNLMWPEQAKRDQIKVIPVCVNVVQAPFPTARRCLKLGEAIGRAVASYEEDLDVVILGTGGLSHQLDGERAGHTNREFDTEFLEKLSDEPEWLLQYSNLELAEIVGPQGVEMIMWLIMRGALNKQVTELSRNYHIPISNTAAGVILLENSA